MIRCRQFNKMSIVLIISLAVIFCGAFSDFAHASGGLRKGMNSFSVKHNGYGREYMVYVPGAMDKTKPSALVFVLHGGGGTAAGAAASFGFNEIAERQKFVVAYPQGYKNHWNDSRTDMKTEAHRLNMDDTGFISSILETLENELKIDKNMVFSAGISNGAMMSHRLGFEMSDKFAAVACVVGSIPEVFITRKMSPKEPVSVIIFNGTEDPLVPWSGGVVAKDRGRVISVKNTVDFWVRFDGCAMTPVSEKVPDGDPKDGVTMRKITYSGGKKGAGVVFYAMEGGGHTWPGRKIAGRLYNWYVGRTCMDMDATGAIWLFFRSHGKKTN